MNNLQQLDEALDYLNEGIKDVFKGAPYGKNEFKRLVSNLLKKNKGNKDKKKMPKIEKPDTISDKLKRMTPEEEKEFWEEREKIKKQFIKDLKTCYNKIKNTKEFKDECLKSSKEFNKAEYYYDLTLKDGYVPKINIKEFEDGGDYLIVEVIDDYQMVRCQYAWILYYIADEYEKEFANKYDYSVGFDYGDGDEGCLYCSM